MSKPPKQFHLPKRAVPLVVIVVMLVFAVPASHATVRSLTFEERVEAQRAIQRVYYEHMIDAHRTFEQAVSESLLERQVRTYLEQSDALARNWATPVTAPMLEAEAARIARETRFPDRLEEIRAALNYDDGLLLETLVRSTLVDRLAHGFHAYDERVQGPAREEAERIRGLLLGGALDPNAEYPGRTLLEVGTPASGGQAQRTRMDVADADEGEQVEPFQQTTSSVVGNVGAIRDEPDGYVIDVTLASQPGYVKVASYRVPKVSWESWWSTHEPEYDAGRVPAVADSGPNALSHLAAAGSSGAVSCTQDDTWDNGSLNAVPDPRYGHSAVWTGAEMIVWGGIGASNAGRYDPLTDSWRPVSPVGAPPQSGQAVWTGAEMIAWGRSGQSGGRYDPVSDTWSGMSTVGQPALDRYTMIWTGTEVIVWGSHYDYGSQANVAVGGRYEPATDLWRPISSLGGPEARTGYTAVWTGTEMIVWGGKPQNYVYGQDQVLATGARYDPANDTWSQVSTWQAPMARHEHTAVWTGTEMIIWGGEAYTSSSPYSGIFPRYGARYDPVTNQWTGIGGPNGRRAHAAVWTGQEMIIWGGAQDPDCNAGCWAGGLYNPATGVWREMAATNSPIPYLAYQSAVWTGSGMIVWGGGWGPYYSYQGPPVQLSASGGRYDLSTNTWTPTATTPMGGASVSGPGPVVWTGAEMLAWSHGGARYDPMTDSWRAMSGIGAPEARRDHAAVWTGDSMVVWGGWDGPYFVYGEPTFSTGGRYDPIADEWRPTSLVNAPKGTIGSTAVWTGREVLFWGGDWSCADPTCFDGAYRAGARYDPAADVWRPISWRNAPEPAFDHTAIWTGHEMIVWGGQLSCYLARWCQTDMVDQGGRYDPILDSWTALPALSHEGRRGHTAVWTGRAMIIFGGEYAYPNWSPSGGLVYDSVADAWSALPIADPGTVGTTRAFHTAVWTGRHMLVWAGGCAGGGAPCGWTGSIYDAMTGSWSRMATAGEPLAQRGRHGAIWTGHEMLVWSGSILNWNLYYGRFFGYGDVTNGGRYIFAQSSDDDGDGLSECQGDCDDTNASIWPGAAEVCDGRDDDCNGLVDEDADGVDTDGDGWPNACDACPAFANPGQSSPLACMTAQQDGGQCLEGQVVLADPIPQGRVTLVRDHPSVPDLVHIDFNVTSCYSVDPVDVYLNGSLLTTFIEPQVTCTCTPPLYRVTIADPGVLASLWNTNGDNVFRLSAPVAPDPSGFVGTYVGWARARIGSGAGGTPVLDVCLADADGGDCTEEDQCVGGYHTDAVDESETVSAAFTTEDTLSATPFSGALPRGVDIAGVPDGSMKLCVEPSGPARLYAADGSGGLYRVDPSTGAATSAGSLPIGVLALAHDDLTRRTWAQSDRPGDHSVVEVDLVGGKSLGTSTFLGLPFSGMEMVGGRLYGIEASASGARLQRVEPESGYGWTVQRLTGAWEGLTYEPATGFFYSARTLNGQSALVTLDGYGGSIQTEHPLSFGPTALELGPGGVLYATRDTGSDTELYTIDPATGAESLLGTLGVPGVVTLTTARNLPRACLDIVKQGERTLSTTGSCNAAPVALASMAATAECTSTAGATVALDGSGSTDMDSTAGTHDDIVLFEWFEDFGQGTERSLGTGEDLDTVLPLGQHAITLRVTDAAGATGIDTGLVNVVDTHEPVVTLTPTPGLLWPPNHRMVAVSPQAGAMDACDPSPSLALIAVASSEADDDTGEADGHTTDDVQGVDLGQADAEVMLRAERAGTGSGRLYTLTYGATDASGNAGVGQAVVYVPHDQGGVTEPILVEVQPAEIRWSAAPGAMSYNVLRGTVGLTHAAGSFTLMEQAVCVAREMPALSVSGGAAADDPPVGEAYTYLVEYFDGAHSGYGTARGVGEVAVVSGDSCH